MVEKAKGHCREGDNMEVKKLVLAGDWEKREVHLIFDYL